MKKLWIKVIPWNKNLVTASLESGADAILIPAGYKNKVRELGLIKTISKDGDIKLGADAVEVTINNKEDEEDAAKLHKDKMLIVKTGNWKIIPLENLVAQRRGIILYVNNAAEAKLAMGILEKGVEGVLLDNPDINEIKRTSRILKENMGKLFLSRAKIKNIRQVGMGDRVCVDTCTNMKIGQGMLIGNTSGAMFLVHSESVENPYVAARPFRVNAGGVHAYIMLPDGKTKYLSDLKAGDEVLIIDNKGNTEIAVLGRSKVEKRPMLMIEGKIGNKQVSLIMQNAETIRLTKPTGRPVSVVSLKPGDEVLAYEEGMARHFGMKIDETILEK